MKNIIGTVLYFKGLHNALELSEDFFENEKDYENFINAEFHGLVIGLADDGDPLVLFGTGQMSDFNVDIKKLKEKEAGEQGLRMFGKHLLIEDINNTIEYCKSRGDKILLSWMEQDDILNYVPACMGLSIENNRQWLEQHPDFEYDVDWTELIKE